ncbi:hypothetical protein [Desulfoscipio gibsoniae]|uniref:Uncharacterized protein n=1 Tax=Desulfoscipio gibsoniae DSM 7213 TaxID=767817 RepID=R4KJU1_9FIRM|nr:hypothetical protein [Desulfoscipio gibsoniae]AGL03463.1 hypothetical protein Desgi_4210 [Desulfoscipio gibsoniae DSM 7213]
MAGAASEKFGSDVVKVEVIYKGFMGLGNKGDDGINPQFICDDVELGKNANQEELEIVVAQKLGKK